MARHIFGQSLTDWTFDLGTGDMVVVVGGQDITFWNASIGGTQYTDLLDASGMPVTEITSSDGTDGLPKGTIPQFKGPDSNVVVMWADAGGGTRYLMVATDVGDVLTDVAAQGADIADLQTQVGGLAAVATSGNYSDLAGKPVLASVATSGDYTDLDGAPAPGMQYVVKVGGSWPTRVTTAPDTARPAMWIGPAPAPVSGSGYALDGDLWVATP